MSVLSKGTITIKVQDATPDDETDVEGDAFQAPQNEICHNTYRVKVRKQGCYVASHTIKAIDALSAINQVELLYGGPVQMMDGSIEDKDGTRHHILVANNWHGYTFCAEKA